MKLKVERRVHDLWKGLKEIEIKMGVRLPPAVGKYQYLYSSKKGAISLIRLNYSLNWHKNNWNNTQWEICGGGITGQRRFPTKIEADKFIRSILS